ncbi:MAG TPA: peptide chain release factor 1, partial [Actinomycetota bacterium]
AKLYQAAQEAARAKEAATRRAQLGSGERAEKIRTYNFPEGRVTDHRMKHTSHRLPDVLAGGEELDAFIDRLQAEARSAELGGDGGG